MRGFITKRGLKGSEIIFSICCLLTLFASPLAMAGSYQLVAGDYHNENFSFADGDWGGFGKVWKR
jgi:hypothetical protein